MIEVNNMIGIVFGCFIPLHRGHMTLINKALSECDKVIIGICGSDEDRGKDFIPFKHRIDLMKKAYNTDNITIVSIDDKKLGLTGKFDRPSWEIWSKELFTNANVDPNSDIRWYMGEQPYADRLSEIYPNHEFTVLDRTKGIISGTAIRNAINLKDFSSVIHPVFYEYLRLKIEKDNIIKWIQNWFNENGPKAKAIIGISGGKDSTIIAKLLVEALGKDRVIGVMMPNGVQPDISDSERVIEFLGIKGYEVNIYDQYNAEVSALNEAGIIPSKDTLINIAPRLRMTTLYAVAQSLPEGGRVCNTCNKSEDYIGYSTKFGDAAGDFSPCADFTVTEMLQIGDILGLPYDLVHKIPSDGLCGKTDEDNLGFTYAELDKYIETKQIDDLNKKEIIDRKHLQNLHKLKTIPTYRKE